MSSYHSSFLLQFVSSHFLYFSLLLFFGAIMPPLSCERARRRCSNTRSFSLIPRFDVWLGVFTAHCASWELNLIFYEISLSLVWASSRATPSRWCPARHIYGLRFESFSTHFSAQVRDIKTSLSFCCSVFLRKDLAGTAREFKYSPHSDVTQSCLMWY